MIERDAATGAERVVLQTSDPGPITETAVDRILEWYNEILREHPWPIAVGYELVFRLLACHPFQDGNGRVGRALFLLALLQCDDAGLIQRYGRGAATRYQLVPWWVHSGEQMECRRRA